MFRLKTAAGAILAGMILIAKVNASPHGHNQGPVNAETTTECKSTGSGFHTCGPKTGLGCEAAKYKEGELPLTVEISSNSSGPPVFTVTKTANDFAKPVKLNYTFGANVFAQVSSPCYQKDGFQYGNKDYGAVSCSISQGGFGVKLSIEGDIYDYGIVTDQPRKVMNVHTCSLSKTDTVLAENTTTIDVTFSQGGISRAHYWLFVVIATAAAKLIA